ncbi:hydroxyethylthiazole kinase [Planomicrobium sp. MB-3u-38]|uniref:hydroxyethylthiazole kinase n=1 Tax=Planomicrobium sp. MB-3u-38 TaxID=2058318 RepID=UPI000C7C1503|nr:hydroxyethylthiazole kinase [Planomicrobium sp. MB-3u-38]PKH11993.1 hydroxyethylthiazole kinase [Planomicrobium sp. MB-3u-38]
MISKIRSENPIIHCITNHVVSNFQANGLLAIGASPIMGEAQEEVEELVAISRALSLNIGTLNKETLHSMLLAGKRANKEKIPVILDPVGAGATAFRKDAIQKILTDIDVSVLRCNAGELAAIGGVRWASKGVDAGEGNVDLEELATRVAIEYSLVVAVTGETDIVADGSRVEKITGGDRMMSSVTGMGCLLSAVTAAFMAVSPDNPTAAAIEALKFYGTAGEKAAAVSEGPGSFRDTFLDVLFGMEIEETGFDFEKGEGVDVLWQRSSRY